MAETIILDPVMNDAQCEALAGTKLGDDSYDLVIQHDADVIDGETGAVVLKFRRNVLDAGVCRRAYMALRNVPKPTNNRGIAAGMIEEDDIRHDVIGRHTKNVVIKGARYFPVKRDGTISRTSYTKMVPSGQVGFMDKSPRFPYCRMTAWTGQHIEKYMEAVPFAKAINSVFKQNMPERYENQRRAIERTHQDFVIPGTVFTTITVNKNWQTAVHTDRGDLESGFGVLSSIWAGTGDGGYLVLPKWRVAANMRSRDVLMADVHQWHGNSPHHGIKGKYVRLSMVFYYRTGLEGCGSAQDELDKVKRMKRKGISQ